MTLEISGWRASHFIEEVCTSNLRELSPGEMASTLCLDMHGSLIDQVAIRRLDSDERGRSRYLMTTHPEHAEALAFWLRGLADGYILFDPDDLFRKVQGPVVVERVETDQEAALCLAESTFFSNALSGTAPELYAQAPDFFDLTKPYFVGRVALDGLATPPADRAL